MSDAAEGNDLWPDDLVESVPTTPHDVLRKQTALLGKKTGNLVVGVVDQLSSDSGFRLDFVLKVPVLGDYRFKLFSLYHDIRLYPLSLLSGVRVATDEDTLQEWLRKELGKPATIKVVRSLVAQARASPNANAAEFLSSDDTPF